jgi:hypothetical protein
MNQEQINITGMHATVAAYMDQNNSIWSGTKAASDAVEQLNSNNDVIAQKRDTQETVTDGATALAMQTKHDFEDKIQEIADQLYALAIKTNNVTLQAQSHWTHSMLDNLDPDKLEQTGYDIFRSATTNLAGLADYGVVQADVDALNQLKTAWSKVKNAFASAMAARSGQTKTLPQAVRDNQSLLKNQLDKLMTKFRKTQPEFYAGYLAARVIYNRRSHHAAKPAGATAKAAPVQPSA